MKMRTRNLVWLSADYHFPTTYSCRVPMSSQNSTLAMPAPGPATVRLAMVRSAIELFGSDYVRDRLFPIIRSAEVYVKPPRKVAISTQLIRVYKANAGRSRQSNHLQESLAYREVCHAAGLMTVYIKLPITHEDNCRETLESIGYWGQANSLACCVGINRSTPKAGDFASPLNSWQTSRPIQHFFSCIVSEFRDPKVRWSEIMPVLGPNRTDAIRLAVYVWPMIIREQHSNSKLLIRHSLV